MFAEALVLSLAALALQASASTKIQDGANQTNWTLNEDSWNYWWSYSGVSGPSYWGLLNLDWFICDKGRRQSPINIDTSSLAYDPNLSPLRADNNLISGLLYNDGHAIVFNASIILPPKTTTTLPAEIVKTIPNGPPMAGGKSAEQALTSKRSSSTTDESYLFGGGAFFEDPAKLELNLVDASFRFAGGGGGGGGEISSQRLENSLLANEIADRTGGGEAGPGESVVELAEAGQSNYQENGNQLDSDAQDNNINFNGGANNPSSQVQFTGAGLAYSYRFETLYLRFALDSSLGSEHQIDSHSYAAEVQLIAFNNQLYKSFAEASTKPSGLLAISILAKVFDSQTAAGANKTFAPNLGPNEQFGILLNQVSELKNRGSSKALRDFNLAALLPETNYFVTYEGSLSTPGCYESVTWLLLNKPLYMTQSNLDSLRSISADEPSSAPSGTLIAGNIRPVQPVNNRPIRTNIRPVSRNNNQHPETCKRLWMRYEYKQSST